MLAPYVQHGRQWSQEYPTTDEIACFATCFGLSKNSSGTNVLLDTSVMVHAYARMRSLPSLARFTMDDGLAESLLASGFSWPRRCATMTDAHFAHGVIISAEDARHLALQPCRTTEQCVSSNLLRVMVKDACLPRAQSSGGFRSSGPMRARGAMAARCSEPGPRAQSQGPGPGARAPGPPPRGPGIGPPWPPCSHWPTGSKSSGALGPGAPGPGAPGPGGPRAPGPRAPGPRVRSTNFRAPGESHDVDHGLALVMVNGIGSDKKPHWG